MEDKPIKRVKKVTEEAGETAIAAVTDDGRLIDESADLLFHLIVLLKSQELSFDDVLKELKKTKFEDQSMNELLVQFTISLGKLLDSIKTARNPKGEKGPAISSAEKKEIYDAFHELENKILKWSKPGNIIKSEKF